MHGVPSRSYLLCPLMPLASPEMTEHVWETPRKGVREREKEREMKGRREGGGE